MKPKPKKTFAQKWGPTIFFLLVFVLPVCVFMAIPNGGTWMITILIVTFIVAIPIYIILAALGIFIKLANLMFGQKR